jgi:flagellar hook assembly protein FlgD
MHFFGIIHTSVEETNEPNVISQGLKIYPNPFTNHLIINVPKSSLANSHSTIRIYDATGKLVRSLSLIVARNAPSNIIWDGKNESGVKLPAGVYFIDTNIENRRQTERVVLVN